MHSTPGKFYLYFKCLGVDNCSVYMTESMSLEVFPGSKFGDDYSYVRLEVVNFDETFDMIMTKIEEGFPKDSEILSKK